MGLQDELRFDNVFIQQINDAVFKNANVEVNVLRLDKLHAIVSGNKWFKLKYYLQEATEKSYTEIATFGGAFSNHIIATAYACNKLKLQCTGFIRGEEPKQYSQTLLDAKALQMKLVFISRKDYKNKDFIVDKNPSIYFIPEGGYGKTGAKGAGDILQLIPGLKSYNYIVCATGTGTMLAGITNACLQHQLCVGISVLKNNITLEEEVVYLLEEKAGKKFKLLHDHHFGGYAKYTDELINFMNDAWHCHHLQLDFVYTAKAFYALKALAEKNFFVKNAKIVFIHSGGLQGNRSLSSRLIY